MPTSRSRSFDYRTSTTGYIEYPAYGIAPVGRTSGGSGVAQYCDDYVAGWDCDNGFDCRRYEYAYPTLSGEKEEDGVVYTILDSLPITYRFPHVRFVSQVPYPTDWAGLKTEHGARMNPSTPHVSVPSFVGELDDFPSLLRHIPEQLHKNGAGWIAKAGGSSLAVQFGVQPFWRDLQAMFNFQQAALQRFAWLKALAEGKSIYRRSKLPRKRFRSLDPWISTHTLGTTVRHNVETYETCSEWVTSRWCLSPILSNGPSLSELSDHELLWKALKLVYGITTYELLAAYWELLPWSWLVDWFSNVGSFIAYHNNTLLLSLASMCYMRHTTKSVYPRLASREHWVSIHGDFYAEYERKERFPLTQVIALPSLPTIPVFTGKQMSILGSLMAMYLNPKSKG